MAEEQVDEEVLEPAAEEDDPTELDEADLADLGVDDDLADVEIEEDEAVVEDEGAEKTNDPAATGGEGTPAPAVTDEEEEDEEEDDDDVEASLDVILKEKLVVADEEAEEEAPEQDDRVESSVNRVLPKQPDEFVCSSCFLVKHPSQLANGETMRCRDCV
ncbi:MAG: DUF4193 domain-containing protein [Actinomycetota bacterium]|nr:DUF4193 domain-containing protein [Actinomycetota bacterium]